MMNRDEKNGVLLKPQWMIAPSASSSSHSNEHSNGTLSRSRSALNAATYNDHGQHWSSSSSSTPYRGTVSSNSSSVRDRGYISFSRSHRDRDRDRDRNRDRVRGRGRDRDRDRERDSSLDNGYFDYSDPVRHKRAERDLPGKSLPLVSGVQIPSSPRRLASAVSNGVGSSSGGGGGDGIASFDSEFPSLGAEDKAKMLDVGRMSTPGVAAGIQSHVPALLDGCTSALVEAPSRVGSNGAQTVANTTSVASSTTTALSMAAALAQAPARVHSAPQLTNDSERKKELMQLVMLVPKVGKRPIHNSLEKSKSKGARSSNYGAPKVSQFSNHQVLNRDKNGVDSTAKDGPTLRTSSRNAPSVGGGVQVVQGHHLQSTVNSKLKVNGKVGGERRPLSQVQGRHDFFNSIRKKEMSRNSSAANLETECVASSSSASNLLAQSCEHITVASASQEDIPAASTCNAELSLVENGNSGACDEEFEMLAPPDEKEAAFLRSLGWEENAVEEPLTQMEIVSFLNKYSKHSVCTKLKAIFPELLHACSS